MERGLALVGRVPTQQVCFRGLSFMSWWATKKGTEPTKSYGEPVRWIDLHNHMSQNPSQQAKAKMTVRECGYLGWLL